MTRLLAATAAAPFALGVLSVFPPAVDPDDQAAADAAVAVFNERLTAAGWTSTGPFTQSGPEGDEETEFGGCLNGFELYLDYTDVHFDGETARAFSNNFELVGDHGSAAAVVLTAAESAVDILDTFVQQLGGNDTVNCIMGQPALDSMADEVQITNQEEIGVGDASARLDFIVSVTYEGEEFTNAATFAAARINRSLVLVVAGGSGAAATDLDPIAELAAVVDTLR